MDYRASALELIKYIKSATSPYQVVEEGIKILEAAGFQELKLSNPWELKAGGLYYMPIYGTTLFAFTVGEEFKAGQSLRIAAGHTDHPGFRVKPKAEIMAGEYYKLNTEVYGGPILSTWMDRPLSLAGRVALRSEDPFHPVLKIIDMKKPFLTIPNLAIHINREVNKGVELNRQTDTLPLLGMLNDRLNKDQFFLKFLAKELEVEVNDILDYDMYIYNAEEGNLLGIEEEFISCPRLDNLTSVLALLKGIVMGSRKEGINLIALYDNEEIGSRSKQGADSSLLTILLEKIYAGLGILHKERLYEAVADSMLISVDVAHGVHPNRPEKYDPTNYTKLGGGVVFKIDSNQKYTFDTEAVAVLQQVCEKSGVKYQKFVNRSDMPGGGTLGPIISSWLPMKTVDLGVPLLAMHSSRELMGTEDQLHLENLIQGFFSL
ncbi:putative M18 family aminopeptidase 2 [Anaerocolumna cellulosilytica]|uniref:M18 family aminopeptidase n=1 Tax=Anaerocolumna cellulosilytica TaxID=433286 RepID=A0A6S6QPF2_9FIRM|nr:M18 family aminopeptidase [Anaerocolumna cellulosilytica]MBB5196226.1 aspartyl aminopeptidase [Anaerocolumna cellulosilytica]BCJ92454.1 putative M18 family aminopeptidase 2 [Anaerocolumna cellulosilytica]